MELMESYINKGHILYVDNYYSSPQLFLDLFSKGTGATGKYIKNFDQNCETNNLFKNETNNLLKKFKLFTSATRLVHSRS